MKLYELSPVPGSTKEPFRKGRGHASGNGNTASGHYRYPWTHRFRCNGCLSEDRLEETGRMCDFTGGFLP